MVEEEEVQTKNEKSNHFLYHHQMKLQVMVYLEDDFEQKEVQVLEQMQ